MVRAIIVMLAAGAIWLGGSAFAQRVGTDPPEGANWSAFAERYLIVYRENRPFSAERDDSRCVRMNNYGCLWQRTTPWEGTPMPDGRDGAHDGAGGQTGHAIFSHPKWSIVAAMRWFETRTADRSGVSALDLASQYAPWCDTIGSRATKADRNGRRWGRSCSGAPQPPARFKGARCARPPNGKPTPEQCDACNCPTSIAAFWLAGSGHSPQAPLTLFDAAGRPNALFLELIRQKTALETGKFKPTDALLREAAASFRPSASASAP